MAVTDSNYNRLFSFASVHDSLHAERVLRQAGIKTLAIPTPREIDLSCGQSLLLTAAEAAAALAALAAAKARWTGLYRRDAVRRIYEKLKEYEE